MVGGFESVIHGNCGWLLLCDSCITRIAINRDIAWFWPNGNYEFQVKSVLLVKHLKVMFLFAKMNVIHLFMII